MDLLSNKRRVRANALSSANTAFAHRVSATRFAVEIKFALAAKWHAGSASSSAWARPFAFRFGAASQLGLD